MPNNNLPTKNDFSGLNITSNAIQDAVLKYDQEVPPPALTQKQQQNPPTSTTDETGVKESPRTAQEYARVMAACAVRKEPKQVAEKPFRDVSPRVYQHFDGSHPPNCHQQCCAVKPTPPMVGVPTEGGRSPPTTYTNFVQPYFAPPALKGMVVEMQVTPQKQQAEMARLPALPNSARKGSFTQLQDEVLQRQQALLQRQNQKIAVTSQSYPQASPSSAVMQTSGAVVLVHPQPIPTTSSLIHNNERQAFLSPRRPSVPHNLQPLAIVGSPNAAAAAGGSSSPNARHQNPVSGLDVAAAIAAASQELAIDERRLEQVGKQRGEQSSLLADVDEGENQSPSSTSAERTELAKLKVLLAQRCREAILAHRRAAAQSASSPSFDVVIMQQDKVVWRASTNDGSDEGEGGEVVSPRGGQPSFVDAAGAPTNNGSSSANSNNKRTAAGAAAEPKKEMLLDEALESFDDETVTDVGEIRLRARNAFQKTVNMFKNKLQEKQTTIAKLKEELRANKPGGSKFEEMEEDLRIVREECRKQLGKIKTLVGLLDRAGQTIKYHEDQRQAEVLGNITRREGAAQWVSLRRLIPKLDVEPPRTDNMILQDVVAFIDDQAERLAEADEHCDELQKKIDGDAAMYDATQKAHKALQRELDHLKFELETMKQRRQYENAEKAKEDIQKELAKANEQLEQRNSAVASIMKSNGGATGGDASHERRRLLDQISALENALKKSSESSRGSVKGFGLEPSVPLFLRFPSTEQVRNVALSKMAVENIVNGIWLSRCFPSLSQVKPLSDVQWLSPGGMVVPDFNKGGPVAKGLARLFAAAVQAVFNGTSGDEGPDLLGNTASVASFDTTNRQPSMMLDLAEAALGASLSRTPELNPERPPGCDFTDDNNWEAWRIKRSEAKRLLHFQDHIARFLVECIDPAACRTLFVGYTTASGASTPPVSNQQLQKKLTLLMQAPIEPTIAHPQVGMPVAVAEVSYALMDGCDRYSFDGDLNLFVRVARGEIPELAFYDMMIMLEKLRIAMLNSHLLYQAPHNWPTPTVATCFTILHRFFPRRTAADLEEMQRTLLLDLAETTINYDDRALSKIAKTAAASAQEVSLQPEKKKGTTLETDALRTPVDMARLFSATESGNQGHFVEYLKSSYITELVRYTDEVEAAIRLAYDERTTRAPSSILGGTSTHDDTVSEAGTTTTRRSSFRRRSSSVTIKEGNGSATSTATTAVTAAASVAPGCASLHAIMMQLIALDPKKPIPELEQFVYQVLLLYVQFKDTEARRRKKEGAKAKKPSDADDDDEDDRPLSPPTPLENEVLGMSKEEAWVKIGGKASLLFMIRVDVFATLSRKVFYRRTEQVTSEGGK